LGVGDASRNRRWGDYVASVIALLLVALSVGLDNFGASTAIGVTGVDRKLRIRVVLIFGLFEAGMPIIGILLGHSVAHGLGSATKPIGGGLLILVGLYTVISELVKEEKSPSDDEPISTKRLLILGVALSIDNLVIGFALGTTHVNLLVAAVTIAVVNVVLSLLGLELGSRIGERLGGRGELVGGVVLIGVGVTIATGVL
jgi:putative Mn2+ efflux pump MntP